MFLKKSAFPTKHYKIAILGHYKTGTTALFYKIKNSLPPDTKTLFEPEEYVLEENDKDHNVLAKVILGIPDSVKYDTFSNFDKKIFIVRDPRDWIVSATLFIIQQIPELYNDKKKLNSILQILKHKEKNPADISLVHILDSIYHSFGQSIDDVSNTIKKLHTWTFDFELKLDNHFKLKYEDFVTNNIRGLEQYLDFPLLGELPIEPQHDHVIRTKFYGDWVNWFTGEDVKFFKPLFKDFIKHYNYEDDWKLENPQHISSKHCSKYVERIVAKRINDQT